MFSSINSFLKYASLYIYWVIDFLNHALPSNSPPRLPWPLSGIHLPLTLKRRLHQPDMRKLWHGRQLIRVKWRLDLDRFPASLARGRVRASVSGTPIRLDPTKKTTKTMTRLWEKVALSSVFVLTLLWFLGSEPACTISLRSAILLIRLGRDLS